MSHYTDNTPGMAIVRLFEALERLEPGLFDEMVETARADWTVHELPGQEGNWPEPPKHDDVLEHVVDLYAGRVRTQLEAEYPIEPIEVDFAVDVVCGAAVSASRYSFWR